MKGGTNLLDMIEALHANKFLPGSGFDLLEYEINDLCNDLVERVEHWAPSDPRCETYDALVLALARQTLDDYAVATGVAPEVREEGDATDFVSEAYARMEKLKDNQPGSLKDVLGGVLDEVKRLRGEAGRLNVELVKAQQERLLRGNENNEAWTKLLDRYRTERGGHLDVLLAIGEAFGLLDEAVRADPSLLVQHARDRVTDCERVVQQRVTTQVENVNLRSELKQAQLDRNKAWDLRARVKSERNRALQALARCRGELEACRQVMTHLKDDQTSNWLDEAARAALDDLVTTLRETSAEALKLDHLDVSLLAEGDEPRGVDAQAQAEVVEVEAPEPGDQISWCHRDPDGFGHAPPSDPETPSREGRWRRAEPGRADLLDVLVRRDDAGRLWWARSFHDLHQQRFRFPVLQDGEWRGPSCRT